MKNVIYNPLENKIPNSAIKNNEKSKFTLFIKKEINVRNLSFVIFKDKEEEKIKKFYMNFLEEKNEYFLYYLNLEPFETGLYFYYFEFLENDKIKYISNFDFNAEISEHISTWQLTVYDKEFKTPDWIKAGIMYQIFPDRFAKDENYFPLEEAKNISERIIHSNWRDIPNSSLDTVNYSAKDFFMGNLKGILSKKDYIKSLNVDIIYLNPIFESSENHRYSTANYFKVDSFLGSNEVFKNFCEEFKKSNINIILDGVFSHTGSDSIYFNKFNRYDEVGAFNSINSKYYKWFKFINYPAIYESWWGFDNLPTLDKENKEYIDFICKKDTGVLNFWQNMGIKGWRIDVLDEFPDIFIDNLRKSIKEKDENSFILGEVWEDASTKFSYNNRRRYLLGKQVDSVMNYPWRTAIIDFMKNSNAYSFASKIMTLINNYPRPALDTMMNILSTHDTERIITVLGCDINSVADENKKDFKLSEREYEKAKNLQKIASFLQFTLPGIPSIYYGEEIGMQGFRDPLNRACFNLETADKELLKHYQELTKFRNTYKEHFKTGFKLAFIDDKLFSYYRNNILCIINLKEKAILLDNITKGKFIYGNKKVFFTDYGLLIGANSFVAIEKI